MIRIDTKAGHGAGKPTSKIVSIISLRLIFIELNFNLIDFMRYISYKKTFFFPD